MELEVCRAFTKAGVPEADAKAVAKSIHEVIEPRHAVQAQALATGGDLAGLGSSIRECVGAFTVSSLTSTTIRRVA